MITSLLIAAAALASTSTQAVPESDPIIVEGRRLNQVTDMTMIVGSQIARFHEPVCPIVAGMARPAAAMVESRIRTTVQEIGGRVAQPVCEGNLLVFISEDGGALFRDIRDKRPLWLSGVSSLDKARLAANGPVRAWSVSSVRNEDGQGASVRGKGDDGQKTSTRTSGLTVQMGMGHMAGYSTLDRAPLLRVYNSSFVENQSRYHLDGSVVIIDAAAAEGLTLRQLGEYAALRGLVQIREPADVAQLDSILSIFHKPKGDGPRQLTAFDRSYLGGLYANLDRKGFESSVYERQRLARTITKGD